MPAERAFSFIKKALLHWIQDLDSDQLSTMNLAKVKEGVEEALQSYEPHFWLGLYRANLSFLKTYA